MDTPNIRNIAFQDYIKMHWSAGSQRLEDDGGDIIVQYPDMDAYAKEHGEEVMETRLEGYMLGIHGEYSDINVYVRYTVLVRWTFSTIDGVIEMVDEQMRNSFSQSHPEFTVKEVSNPVMSMKPQIMSLRPDKEGFHARVKMFDTDRPKDYKDISISVKRRPEGDKIEVKSAVRKGRKVKGYIAHRRGWDAVEENRALQLRNQNVSYRDIGTVLNRSASSVATKFYRPKTWSVAGWVVSNARQRARDIKSIARLHGKSMGRG